MPRISDNRHPRRFLRDRRGRGLFVFMPILPGTFFALVLVYFRLANFTTTSHGRNLLQ